MAKHEPVKDPDEGPPETKPDEATEPVVGPAGNMKEVEVLARRHRAIEEYLNHGYQSAKEKRRVKSIKHAEFLARAGVIELP